MEYFKMVALRAYSGKGARIHSSWFRGIYQPLIETEYMAAILITVEIINFGEVCLAIGEESIYVPT